MTDVDVATEVERARMRAIIDIDARIARLKEKRADLAGSLRHAMQRDGVVRTKNDFCVTTLLPRRTGSSPHARREARRLGAYVHVKPIGGNDAA